MFNDLCIGEVPSRFKRAKSVRRAVDDAYCGHSHKCEAAAAIASVVGGGAALVAGVKGFAALAAFGAIVGGVGARTGDSTLTKIGAVMGIAGGVGSFGASQGWWGDIGANATAAVGEGGNIQNLVQSNTAGIEASSSAAPAAESVTSEAIASGVEPSAAAMGDSGSIGESLAQSTNANVSEAIGKSSGLMDSGYSANYPITDTGTMSVPGADAAASTATNIGLGDGIGMATQAPTFWDRFSSAAENVSTWMDKHKVASEAVLRGVGGLAETYGTKGGLTDAQRRFYEARIKSENAALANANYGGPDITKQFALKPGTTPYVGTGIMFSGKK